MITGGFPLGLLGARALCERSTRMSLSSCRNFFNRVETERAMASQIAKVLLSLDAEAVGSLKEGVNFKKSPEDGKCYIIFKSNNDFKACKNQCKHQGGLFIKDIEDLDGM
uniref:Rieske domain-containing protein n=1 Tax=Neolamprologus brichardi TaxID=32507 RepID=A0A3Q4GFU0_NEOBR